MTIKLTHEHLLEVLHYDPDTGEWTWRIDIVAGKGSIKIHAGDKAGWISEHGYLRIMIDGETYMGGPLTWFYMTGEWPKMFIDHKDTIKSNNKWNNLREASRAKNGYNQTKYRNNTSGHKNVMWKKRNNKWAVVFTIDGVKKHIGYFDDLELAAFVASEYRDAAHKEFANHG